MRLLPVIFSFALLLMCACGPQPAQGRIKDQNDAAASGATAGPDRETEFGGFSGAVYTYDLRPGDCFESDATWRRTNQVIRVTCDKVHDFEVLNLVSLTDYEAEPADDVIEQTAAQQCDVATTDFMYPSEDTWFIGDRTIVCLKSASSATPGPQS